MQSGLHPLPGRRRVNGERMDAAFQFRREGLVDHAVTFEPALSAEGFRHNIKPVMGLAAGAVSGVAGMLMRFVLDAQALWSESHSQLFGNHILGSHSRSFTGGRPNRQCRDA